jgi:hypothetical protein
MFKLKNKKLEKTIDIIDNFTINTPVLPNYVVEDSYSGPCTTIEEFDKLAFEVLNCADYESEHLTFDILTQEKQLTIKKRKVPLFEKILRIVCQIFM